jgi:uncharacterized membrane protein
MDKATYLQIMESVVMIVDGIGVLVILSGVAAATGRVLFSAPPAGVGRYEAYRRSLARAILVGLEILIAGDIIKTVTVAPTLQNMAGLAMIVAIRTFLSFTLELEVNGRWPWQKPVSASAS